MVEFTGVISSTALGDEQNEAVANVCPRVLLGLTCLAREYPPCLCEQVAKSQIETMTNDNGVAPVVKLTLDLIPNAGEPRAVMSGLNLTGYRADYEASKDAVTATFNLRRPENSGLALFVRESGL